MKASDQDPYTILGVSPDASDDELHTAYRRLVQLHHPDHNQGSLESARRFEEVQEAYARIRELRASARTDHHATPRATTDPNVEARLADLERELRQAHEARERARRAAAEAAATTNKRPSDEELGYVNTDDSLAQILDDARSQLSERFADAREHPVGRRVADLIDDLATKLQGRERK
jgi:curved DNA-binding protein CbpA